MCVCDFYVIHQVYLVFDVCCHQCVLDAVHIQLMVSCNQSLLQIRNYFSLRLLLHLRQLLCNGFKFWQAARTNGLKRLCRIATYIICLLDCTVLLMVISGNKTRMLYSVLLQSQISIFSQVGKITRGTVPCATKIVHTSQVVFHNRGHGIKAYCRCFD